MERSRQWMKKYTGEADAGMDQWGPTTQGVHTGLVPPPLSALWLWEASEPLSHEGSSHMLLTRPRSSTPKGMASTHRCLMQCLSLSSVFLHRQKQSYIFFVTI